MHRALAVASAVAVTLLIPAPADADSSSQEGTRLFLVAGAEKHCQADIAPRCRRLRDAVPGSSAMGMVTALATGGNGDVLVASGLFGAMVHRIGPDGRVTTVAGGGASQADGVPALEASVNAYAVAPAAGNAFVFADASSYRIRRVSADGVVTTLAGTGVQGSAPDGVSATAAPLGLWAPSVIGLLSLPDGGFMFSELANSRVRRVTPDGLLTTAATVHLPQGLAALPDGTVAVVDGSRLSGTQQILRIASDGTISTLSRYDPVQNPLLFTPAGVAALPNGELVVSLDEGGLYYPSSIIPTSLTRILPDGSAVLALGPGPHPDHGGDFAGRFPRCGGPLTTTPDGGVFLADRCEAELWFIAPAGTARPLIALRDARASASSLTATLDATRPGSVELRLRRKGRTVASTSSPAVAGTQTLSLAKRFEPGWHRLQAIWAGPERAVAADSVGLFLGARLPKRLARRESRDWVGDAPEYYGSLAGCRRMTARRIDCQLRYSPRGKVRAGPCVAVRAFRLMPSGVIFAYSYGCRSRHGPPFRAHPRWLGGEVVR